jgi:hypothetical protein
MSNIVKDISLNLQGTGGTVYSISTVSGLSFSIDSDGVLYSGGTPLQDIFTTGDFVGGMFLPLSGGSMTGDITMTNGYVIKALSGGGNVNLSYGAPSKVLIDTNFGGYNAQQLYMEDGYVELSDYSANGQLALIAQKNYMMTSFAPILDGSYVMVYDGNFDGAAYIGVGQIDAIKINYPAGVFSATTDADMPGTIISSRYSFIESGVTNSAIIGGVNITGTSSNTVFVPNLSIQSGKVITSQDPSKTVIEFGNLGNEYFGVTVDGGAWTDTFIYMDNSGVQLQADSASPVFGSSVGMAIVKDNGGDWDNSVIIQANNTTAARSNNISNPAIFVGAQRSKISATTYNSVVVGGSGHTITSGLTNVVIAGGLNISATTSNTFYTQNARLAENGGVIYSAGTDLYNVFATGAMVGGTFLPLSGGTMTGDITMSGGTVMKSLSGGGQLNLRAYNANNKILLDTNNGGYNAQQLYMENGYVELSDYSAGGSLYLFGDKSIWATSSYPILVPLQNSFILLQDGNSDGNILIGVGIQQDVIKINGTQGSANVTMDSAKPGTLISTQSSFLETGVTNSVIIGGAYITGNSSNTLFTQSARLAENGGVIYSGGTDLYNIFGAGSVKSYATTLTTPGAGVTNTITHNLGTTDIQVSLWLVTTGDLTQAQIANRTSTTVDVIFASAPGENIRVVIMG